MGRILPFRVLHSGPLFSKTPMQSFQRSVAVALDASGSHDVIASAACHLYLITAIRRCLIQQRQQRHRHQHQHHQTTTATIATTTATTATTTATTRHVRFSPPRKLYRWRLEGCRAQMNAEVVKTPAGAVNSRCCIKSGHIGMHGKVWQAWVKRQILHISV